MNEPATPTARRVAVAGGTGVVGRHVVAALTAAGHTPVVLSRSTGIDVVSGDGLAAALDGAHAVVDVTNLQTLRRAAAVRFFEAATRNLLQAQVPHLVALSIVGVDVVPSGYYSGKLRQEELLLGSGRPVTLLRATQFHEFAGQLLDRGGIGPLKPGPQEHELPELARRVLAARGGRGRVVPLPLPGRTMRTGLLPGPGARLGSTTFEQWLASGAA